jgi:hypothetical protein
MSHESVSNRPVCFPVDGKRAKAPLSNSDRFRMIDSKRALDESSHNGSERRTVRPIHIASA